MEREIQFRAWDGEKMYIPSKITLFKNVTFISFNFPLGDELEKEQVSIMQYIGVKDKNGVEIYEGDKVKYFYTECVVKWYQGTSAFVLENVLNDEKYTIIGYDERCELCEVIGNIYENENEQES